MKVTEHDRAKGNTLEQERAIRRLYTGFYGRVARKLDVDPSLVSRVDRKLKSSKQVEGALAAEYLRILRERKRIEGGNVA